MKKKILDYISSKLEDEPVLVVCIIVVILCIVVIALLSFFKDIFGIETYAEKQKIIHARMKERVARISELEASISMARASLDKSSGDIHAWKVLADSQNECIILLRGNIEDTGKKAANNMSAILMLEAIESSLERMNTHMRHEMY